MSASVGMIGGAGAQYHLHQTFVLLERKGLIKICNYHGAHLKTSSIMHDRLGSVQVEGLL
jgi:hypothetical protein